MKITIALCAACGAPCAESLARLAVADRTIELWWAADLCGDPASLRKLFDSGVEYLVVLGASKPEERETWYEAARAGGLHPLNLDFVDVPTPPTPDACEAVLRSARAAVRDFRGADSRHAKPTARVRGAVTRRSFLRGMRPSAIVAIPRILEDRCRSQAGCQLCVPECPTQALQLQGRILRMRATACMGCNRCVAACPTAALDNPFSDFPRLRARVTGWVEATRPGPRRLVLACTPAATVALRSLRRTRKPEALFLEVPCLGALRAHEYLDLVAAGIDEVVAVRDGRFCEPTQRCADPMPQALSVVSDLPHLRGRLVEAEPRELPLVLQRAIVPSSRKGTRTPFRSLHDAVAWASDASQGRMPIRGRGAGFVEIRADRCTGCLVCRDRCPTGAITASESGDLQIAFRHAACDGCGLCEAACPEGALTVHQEIRIEALDSVVPLFSGGWARCRECGARIAPRPMVVEVASRVGKSVESFELCPRCRLTANAAKAGRPASGRPADTADEVRPQFREQPANR